MMFKSSGTLRYSPKPLGITTSKWWLVVDCDKVIGEYYRYWYYKSKYKVIRRPAWFEHISVIANEEPIDDVKSLWGLYSGQEIEFEYSHKLIEGNGYVWLEVYSPFLLDIREKYKLSREPFYPLHLTIGNVINDIKNNFKEN